MITVTGGKYALATLSSVGTSTVTVSTTPFVSTDFTSVQRIAALYSSGGAFLGIAYVRAFVSTSQLSLETAFWDPLNFSLITQAVGQTVLVSKSFADIVTTGLSISNNIVTQTDQITFGSGATQTGFCFYDESKVVNVSGLGIGVTPSVPVYLLNGGVFVLGHLQDFTGNIYGGINHRFVSATAQQNMLFQTLSSNSAVACIFGGNFSSILGYYAWGARGITQNDYYRALSYGVNYEAVDILSGNNGGNWVNGAQHQLLNNSHDTIISNSILSRFGNGIQLGGHYKIPLNSQLPIGAFGSDAVGAYAVGANPGQRAIVADLGGGHLWRSSTAAAQALNLTNLISPLYDMVTGASGVFSPNNNGIVTLYFQDPVTNLVTGSVGNVLVNSAWTSDSSGTASGGTLSLTVKDRTATQTLTGSSTRGPWTQRIRLYGYAEIENAVSEVTYSLGNAGNGYNVPFASAAVQVTQPNITAVKSTSVLALAIPGITVTDHGASPVTWLGNVYSISITVDLVTYPATTASQVWAFIKASISSLSAFSGKPTGLDWHVLLDQVSGVLTTQRGVSGGAGAAIKGVRVVDTGGNAIPGIPTFVADNGTVYNVPQPISILAPNILPGSFYQLYDVTTSTVIVSGTVPSGGVNYTITYTNPDTIRLRTAFYSGTTGYLPTQSIAIASPAGITFLDTQISDTVYNSNAIDGSTVTEYTTDYVNIFIDVSSGNSSPQRLYAWYCYDLMTSQGIASFFMGITAIDAGNYQINNTLVNLYINNTTAGSIAFITGAALYRADGATPISSSTVGSVDIFNGKSVVVGVSGLTALQASQLNLILASVL